MQPQSSNYCEKCGTNSCCTCSKSLKYADIKQDTPRLVVMFHREGRNERFQWGVVGSMPMMSLIGAIVRVQSEISFKAGGECPEPALALVWDEANRKVEWFIHSSLPIDPLVGMLEAIKTMLLATYMARQAANQQVILGPDGQPMQR